jgi:6-phosphogluconolactonase (cycloisomerase 2 family)
MKWIFRLAIIGTLGVAACADDTAGPSADAGSDARIQTNPDLGTTTDAANNTTNPSDDAGMDATQDVGADTGTEVCWPAPSPNRTRKLVVSRPYDENAMASGLFVVHDVALDGTVSPPTGQFTLSRTSGGKIQFTPDGSVAYVRLDDGKIGAFRILADGSTEIIHQAFAASEYVSEIVIAPDGQYLYMLTVGFRNVAGGIYRAKIDCKTGELTDEGLMTPAKLAYGMEFVSPTRAFVEAVDIADTEVPGHVHEITVGDTITRVASGSAFTGEDIGLGGFAVTPDAKFAIVGDTGLFSMHSISVVSLVGNIASVQNFPVEDPEDIAVSPFNNAAIILSLQGDKLEVYDVDTSKNEPLTFRSNLATAAPVLLPADLVMLRQGDLEGHAYIAENVAIRHIVFRPSGTVEDLGLTSNGAGLTGISGAIGVQP